MITTGSDSELSEPATAGDRMEVVGELAGTTIATFPETWSEVKSGGWSVCKFKLRPKITVVDSPDLWEIREIQM